MAAGIISSSGTRRGITRGDVFSLILRLSRYARHRRRQRLKRHRGVAVRIISWHTRRQITTRITSRA